ncbi:MAG: acyltransferase family protein [Actinobacteria bacterium]|nr:acyltransferase family protein [Actinomycetota bacterium]
MILEIQGLRAVAALLVVLFHARFSSGGFIGVDIFYVISGYLITGLLLREIEKTGRISFVKFFARRIKRLLPSSFLVLFATAIASFFIMPSSARSILGRDVVAGALYISNYLFAYWQNDYQNLGATPSPIIHYWSLAVEEQFYLVWPFLLFGALKIGGRNLLFRVIAGTTVASFAYSLYLTSHSPIWSFYSLPTRAWELGVGALILWRPPTLRLPKILPYIFVVAIFATSFTYNSGTPFPGWAAIPPVLGCAGLIRYVSQLPKIITYPIRNPFAQWLGAISYPAYLWHWPVLILAPQWLGHPLSVSQRILGIAFTLILADLTHRFVEQPLRFIKIGPKIAFSLALLSTLTSASLGGAIAASTPKNLTSGFTLAEVIRKPAIYADGCQLDKNQVRSGPCEYGDPNGRKTVVLFGDSHAAQWFPTLNAISKTQRWKLVVLTKSSCPAVTVTLPDIGAFRNTQCAAWRENSFLRIASLKPWAVITGNFAHYSPPKSISNFSSWWKNGYLTTMSRLNTLVDSKGFVIALEDTPLPKEDVPSCLSSSNATSCLAIPSPPVFKKEKILHIESKDWFCDAKECPAIRYGIVVYRDTTHISVDYALHLVPELTAALRARGVL